MKESLILRFLYETMPGRMALKLLVCPGISRMAGDFLSSGASRCLVPYYIRKHKISMKDVEVPPGGFPSFNAFFTRKRKREQGVFSEGCLLSPCDGLLSRVEIGEDTVFRIKNTEFSLKDLLKDDGLAARFQDGTAFIFRLTPADYHHYCYAASGRLLSGRKIPGKLHCVRPVALRNTPVFVQNSRAYQVMETDAFGTLVQMEVGALLVGKIKNDSRRGKGDCAHAGEEKGHFEFGGSTILLLAGKGAVHFRSVLYERQIASEEMPVRMGEVIGSAGMKGIAEEYLWKKENG